MVNYITILVVGLQSPIINYNAPCTIPPQAFPFIGTKATAQAPINKIPIQIVGDPPLNYYPTTCQNVLQQPNIFTGYTITLEAF